MRTLARTLRDPSLLAVLALVAISPLAASAQSQLDTSQAAAFIGTWAIDFDSKPSARPISYQVGQSHEVPNSATGLRFSRYHYRGPGAVTFDPPQTKVWEDRRDGGNSPWSAGWRPPAVLPENRWTARATSSGAGHRGAACARARRWTHGLRGCDSRRRAVVVGAEVGRR